MGKEDIKGESTKHFQLSKNENATYQNLLDAIKAVLGGGGRDYSTKLHIINFPLQNRK